MIDDTTGEIYMILFPNGRRYIGQCKSYSYLNAVLVKRGVEKRLKEHISDSKKNNDCKAIVHRALNKYGEHNCIVKTILICNKHRLDYYEVKFIRQYNTLKPNGYNMNIGGRFISRISYNEKFRFTEEQKDKMRLTISKLPRTPANANLPMYVFTYSRYYYGKTKTSIKEGYEVTNHPYLKAKLFCSQKMSMETKLQLALNYLNSYQKPAAVHRLNVGAHEET